MSEISPISAGRSYATDYPLGANAVRRVSAPVADGEDSLAIVNNLAPVSEPAEDAYISPTSSDYVDPRRYTQFDRSAAHVQDAPDFSFGDFLDMINPLQHIPVVSSVYRSLTGDNINPVSRIAGDILYGGAIGAASAILGGVSAVGDAVAESQTGHDATGIVLATLFGEETAKPTGQTQLAEANQAPQKTEITAQSDAAVPAPVMQAAQKKTQELPETPEQWVAFANTINSSATANNAVAKAPLPNIEGTNAAVADAAAAKPLTQGKTFPLNRAAYGGVMAPTSTTDNIEQQNRIIALSEGSHAMRLGNTIYTNRMMNGQKPLPAAQATANAGDKTAAPVVAPAAPATTSAAASTPPTQAAQRNPLPQNLIDDMIKMRAISQYQGTASANGRSTPLGSTLDMTN